MPFNKPNMVQLRIELLGIYPAIWRRVVIPLSWNLEQLHLAIQAAFNWWNYHLHEFNIGGLIFTDIKSLDGLLDSAEMQNFDEKTVRLQDFDPFAAVSFLYRYDFGDRWEHLVEIEKIFPAGVFLPNATCIEGARARPPEDVGGIQGYQDFLCALAESSHPRHCELKKWCGGYFDPEWFDLSIINKDLKNALKPAVRRRLYQPKPKRVLL
ncbi:plasmid pRiA4b ORF-3 family protein [Methylocystis sp. WRRC1]|uniref:plasmid pRiA4b ORF-3 family protein n=1 Tax=Methylocystis sp. WRRC1 TaxID=1732014 RepID=UPI001D137862|nr:plasmid pRiA4b ORF-3 family protein [Methylocystis sp. WRRC1]MCC3244328.1 plasmid pRiA4b ORF-3 family protein [Methylocystis sp. WRRC1]